MPAFVFKCEGHVAAARKRVSGRPPTQGQLVAAAVAAAAAANRRGREGRIGRRRRGSLETGALVTYSFQPLSALVRSALVLSANSRRAITCWVASCCRPCTAHLVLASVKRLACAGLWPIVDWRGEGDEGQQAAEPGAGRARLSERGRAHAYAINTTRDERTGPQRRRKAWRGERGWRGDGKGRWTRTRWW